MGVASTNIFLKLLLCISTMQITTCQPDETEKPEYGLLYVGGNYVLTSIVRNVNEFHKPPPPPEKSYRVRSPPMLKRPPRQPQQPEGPRFAKPGSSLLHTMNRVNQFHQPPPPPPAEMTYQVRTPPRLSRHYQPTGQHPQDFQTYPQEPEPFVPPPFALHPWRRPQPKRFVPSTALWRPLPHDIDSHVPPFRFPPQRHHTQMPYYPDDEYDDGDDEMHMPPSPVPGMPYEEYELARQAFLAERPRMGPLTGWSLSDENAALRYAQEQAARRGY